MNSPLIVCYQISILIVKENERTYCIKSINEGERKVTNTFYIKQTKKMGDNGREGRNQDKNVTIFVSHYTFRFALLGSRFPDSHEQLFFRIQLDLYPSRQTNPKCVLIWSRYSEVCHRHRVRNVSSAICEVIPITTF